MEENGGIAEAQVLAVEASYRIRIPQAFCQRVGWFTGGTISAWLLVINSSRSRLLSAAEVDNDSKLKSLQSRIVEELGYRTDESLEFQDATLAALGLRLTRIQINRQDKSGWRLTVPRPIAAAMQLRPTVSSLIALIVQEHIEFWTVELLRTRFDVPFSDIL